MAFKLALTNLNKIEFFRPSDIFKTPYKLGGILNNVGKHLFSENYFSASFEKCHSGHKTRTFHLGIEKTRASCVFPDQRVAICLGVVKMLFLSFEGGCNK